ncbi:hypothetical protein AB0I94_25145 [Streptomyces sp. NPDC050147]|uniref:hypothetical protein n=1 Tax=Streptomyces sp. NPDC050147 TaxID=3155513 RepID=UPI003416F976
MIHISETLALHTTEGFLTDSELTQLRKIMHATLDETGWQPRHQAEILLAPVAAQDILQDATRRALPAIRRTMPSISAAAPWAYTELTAGQEVPTHLDGIPDPGTAPRRLGRIGVVLDDAEAGGDFYIETTSSPGIWTGEEVGEGEGFMPSTPLTHRLPHASEPGAPRHASAPTWLEGARRTRWTTDARAGTAVAYGSQVIHGVSPVRAGRLRKFVTDLLDEAIPALP